MSLKVFHRVVYSASPTNSPWKLQLNAKWFFSDCAPPTSFGSFAAQDCRAGLFQLRVRGAPMMNGHIIAMHFSLLNAVTEVDLSPQGPEGCVATQTVLWWVRSVFIHKDRSSHVICRYMTWLRYLNIIKITLNIFCNKNRNIKNHCHVYAKIILFTVRTFYCMASKTVGIFFEDELRGFVDVRTALELCCSLWPLLPWR